MPSGARQIFTDTFTMIAQKRERFINSGHFPYGHRA